MSKIKTAAIICVDDNLGLLSAIQIDNEKDSILVVQTENRWRTLFPIDNIQTFILPGTRSEFLHNWANPTDEFVSLFKKEVSHGQISFD